MPNKAVAAGGSTALAGALVTLLLSLFNHPVPPEVAGALTTLISAAFAALAVYVTPHEGTV